MVTAEAQNMVLRAFEMAVQMAEEALLVVEAADGRLASEAIKAVRNYHEASRWQARAMGILQTVQYLDVTFLEPEENRLKALENRAIAVHGGLNAVHSKVSHFL